MNIYSFLRTANVRIILHTNIKNHFFVFFFFNPLFSIKKRTFAAFKFYFYSNDAFE
jgi:hypothetical protein